MAVAALSGADLPELWYSRSRSAKAMTAVLVSSTVAVGVAGVASTVANFSRGLQVTAVLNSVLCLMYLFCQTHVPTPRNIYAIQILQFAPVLGSMYDTFTPS